MLWSILVHCEKKKKKKKIKINQINYASENVLSYTCFADAAGKNKRALETGYTCIVQCDTGGCGPRSGGLEFLYLPVCPILLGQLAVWQNWLGI